MSRPALWLFAIATVACAQPPPDQSDQTKILAAIREAALAFSKNLPDFIFTQTTRREMLPAPESPSSGVHVGGGRRGGGQTYNDTPRWQLLDTFQEQVSY